MTFRRRLAALLALLVFTIATPSAQIFPRAPFALGNRNPLVATGGTMMVSSET